MNGMPMQFNITQIENGWLVATPPQQGRIRQQQQESPGTVQFCSDYNEVVTYMKEVWPVEISDK